MRTNRRLIAVTALLGSLTLGSTLARAGDDERSACKGLPSHAALRGGARGGAGPGRTADSDLDMWAHGRQPRRRRLRRGVHRQQPRRSVARQPRDLGAEGEHGQRVQPAGARAVDGEPLLGRAAGRQPVRPAGEQPRQHRRRVRRQPGEQRPGERSDGRRAHRRRERVRRRARAVQRRRQAGRRASA